MNIELSLLAKMLQMGDFGPLIKGEITKDHFETEQGGVLYDFITDFRDSCDGAAAYPSLKIIRNRFKATIELPDPDPGDTVANLTVELKVERFRSELRQLAVNAEQIADTSTEPFSEVIPLIAALRRATESAQQSEHVSVATGIQEVADNYKKKDILPHGISYPWPSFTDATRGLHKKECIAIVGRPKSRKTFTALRIATHAFKNEGKRVLIFTPEMPAKQIFLRTVAHLCDLPYSEFKSGEMPKAEEARLFEAARAYFRGKDNSDVLYRMQMEELYPDLKSGSPIPGIDIVQSTGRDTAWMASQIELYEPDLVVVDSYYRHRAAGQKKNDSDWKAVTAISREMKDLAMQNNVAMVLTSQLNREAQKSVGDISNIAFADAIAADMDGIWRVITGKIEGQDVSALVAYAARETPFDGVMIRNCPCYDYSELGKITNRKQVEDLLKQEDSANAKEENEKLREKVRNGAPRAATINTPAHIAATRARPSTFVRRAKNLAGMGAFQKGVASHLAAANAE